MIVDLPLPTPVPDTIPLYSPAFGAILSLTFCLLAGLVLYCLCNDKQRKEMHGLYDEGPKGMHQQLPTDSEHSEASNAAEVDSRHVSNPIAIATEL